MAGVNYVVVTRGVCRVADRRAWWTPDGGSGAVLGEVEQFEDLGAEGEEGGVVAAARAGQGDVDHALDAGRARGHDDDAVAHVDRLVDVVGDEEHGGAAGLPEAQDL